MVEQSARRPVNGTNSHCFNQLSRILWAELLVIRPVADKYPPSRALSNPEAQFSHTFRARIIVTGHVLWLFHRCSPRRFSSPIKSRIALRFNRTHLPDDSDD